MAKNSNSGQLVQQLLAGFAQLPMKAKIAVGVLALTACGLLFALSRTYMLPRSPNEHTPDPTQPTEFPAGAKTIVLCLWNMENLFDDKDDKRRSIDEPYDAWFVNKPEDRRKKYEKLAVWLVKQNGGIGPDIVVGNEIESHRAAELLQEALNAALPTGATRYEYVAMRDLDAGRHIAPCVVSRYPLSGVKLLGSRMRTLEAHVTVNKHDLFLVASHWTSQLTDKSGDEDGKGRAKYATSIHEIYAESLKGNPKLDFLVCGDFNDSPDSESVAHRLHLTADATQVRPDTDPPKLFGPLSDKKPADFGTHYYSKPLIYDQVGISPGMFDNVGWGYVPDSVKVPTEGLIRSGSRNRQPWRYGSEKDNAAGRGFSDHFPVLVTLKVAP